MSQHKGDEFTRRFRAASTDLERIKLAIVVELKYLFRGAGKSIPIYMKGYFSKDGHLVLGLEIQSLRMDE